MIEIFSQHARVDEYDLAESVSKPDGYFIVDGHEAAVTRQCVHCGRHWIWIKGSGKKRGFCMNCQGVTCGTRACDPCIHWRKKMDEYEKGKRNSIA